MRTLSFFLIICSVFLTENILAQTAEEGIGRASYGVFGDFSLNYHSANFQGLPGVPSCCPRYETGSGTGPAFGGFYILPLTSFFDLDLRVAYRSLSGTLSAIEQTTVFHNGGPVTGAFTHTLVSGLSTVEIESMLGIKVVADIHLNLGVGAGILLKKTYSQQEEITQPDGAGTFLDSLGNDTHSRIRNQLSGTIPGASLLHLSALGGITYSLPLVKDRSTLLVPEVLYAFGLSKIATGLVWNVNSLRFGLGLEFSPRPRPKHEREEHIDTLRIDKKGINAMKFIRGKENTSQNESERDGLQYITESVFRTDTLYIPKFQKLEAAIAANVAVAQLKIEEFSSTIMTPLLNYVFFDESSSDIPQRYTRMYNYTIDTFAIDHIHSSAKLATYHQLLNIIARRMLDNPSATLTLTGCNQDVRDEKGNLQLSKDRAESVKSYLTGTWRIAQDRIKTEARNLSLKAANSETADGAQENRRVEITSSDPKILFPVITNDTLRTANPPTVTFIPSVTTEAGLDTWKVTAMQDGRPLKRFDGKGDVPASIDWNLEASSMPRMNGEVKYMLVVKDVTGMMATSEHTLPFEKITIQKKREERRGDTTINRFSLILFDVGSSTVSQAEQPVISLIKGYVQPLSQITITGYTDRLGEALYNQQLSEKRALTIAGLLGSKRVVAKGVGPTDLYDPTLPEGRLYTRTVEIEIRTPIGN